MIKLISARFYYQLDGKKKNIEFSFDSEGEADGVKWSWARKKSSKGESVILSIESDSEIEAESLRVQAGYDYQVNDRVFVNGYQSWTESREYGLDERRTDVRMFFAPVIKHYCLRNFGDSVFVHYSKKKGDFHSYTYTYVRQEDGAIHFAGSLSEKNGFTLFRTNLSKKLLIIEKMCERLHIKEKRPLLEIFLGDGTDVDVFDEYFSLMGVSAPHVSPCSGWTSWYNYYEKITEKIILDNLQSFRDKKIPMDVFQIDDGYQEAVGDWLDINDKFPNGMKSVAKAIKQSGYQAGLWLAPFICEESSNLKKHHPDWLVKDKHGNPVKIGNNPFNWSGNFYSLDIYHSGVREYLKKVFDTVLNEWGFDMVKLDFLYAACFLPRDGKPRGKIMCDGMEFLREIIGDKKILGCGMPLGAGFGLVDYCRIGSDVALSWEDLRLKMLRYRERVSTFNSLTSTIGRHHLNGRAFLNDPDVFHLRDDNIWLSENQKYTLFLLNLIFGGLVFTSDNISKYSENTLNLYLSLFPHKEKNIHSVDWDGDVKRISFSIGELKYLVYSNLGDISATLYLEEGNYFESGAGFVSGDAELELEPYESVCLLKTSDEDFSIIGSSGHIFPGSEVDNISVTGSEADIVLNPKMIKKDDIYINVPQNANRISVNGKVIEVENFNDKNFVIYRYFAED